MYIKIYEGFTVEKGALVPTEKEKIIGLTMLQTEQLDKVLSRYSIMHEVGEE